MGKPNTYAQLLTAKREILRLNASIEIMKGFTIQQCIDMAQIALADAFGFGPERNQRFQEAFRDTFLEYAQLCVDDGRDDKDLVYTKEKVDRALRIACGEEILPFDERYAEERLYFRDRFLKEKKK